MSKTLILLRISVCVAQELVGDGVATGTRSIQRGIDARRCYSLRAHDAYLCHCCWCRWSVPLVALVLDPLRLVSIFASWLHFAELLPAVLKLAIPALLALVIKIPTDLSPVNCLWFQRMFWKPSSASVAVWLLSLENVDYSTIVVCDFLWISSCTGCSEFLIWLCMCSGPRITWPRVFRWQICGAIGAAAAMATFTRLWEPACEPQNIAAYDS